jgi:hypothetical protein
MSKIYMRFSNCLAVKGYNRLAEIHLPNKQILKTENF